MDSVHFCLLLQAIIFQRNSKNAQENCEKDPRDSNIRRLISIKKGRRSALFPPGETSSNRISKRNQLQIRRNVQGDKPIKKGKRRVSSPRTAEIDANGLVTLEAQGRFAT